MVSEVSLLQCRRSCHSVQHPGRATELRVWSFSTYNSLKTDLKVSGFQRLPTVEGRSLESTYEWLQPQDACVPASEEIT